MGLYLKQNETRSELRQRIEKELQEKARQKSGVDPTLPDGVEDSNFIQGTKQTTGLAWAWMGIFLAIIAIAVFLLVISI